MITSDHAHGESGFLKMPQFSICGTMWNDAHRLKGCLDSIIEEMNGLDYEIVLVDNFSNDGSYEIAESYAKRDLRVRVVRKKCTRGEGRRLAIDLSRGEFITEVTTDYYFHPTKLRTMVEGYMKSDMRGKKCVWAGRAAILPRHILKTVANYRDFYYDSNLDLVVRLFSAKKAVYLPVSIAEGEEAELHRKPRKIPRSRNLLRFLRVGMDLACTHAVTTRKAILSYRYKDGVSILKTLVRCLGLAFPLILNRLFLRRPFHGHPLLSNDTIMVYYRMTNLANPLEFGFTPSDIEERHKPHNSTVRFLLMFYPNLSEIFDRVESWRRASNNDSPTTQITAS